jgi:CspA family cold shock protein
MENKPERCRGVVRWFDDIKGFGYLSGKGRDIFVHHSNIRMTGRRTLFPEEAVEYTVAVDERHRSYAKDVVKLAESQ